MESSASVGTGSRELRIPLRVAVRVGVEVEGRLCLYIIGIVSERLRVKNESVRRTDVALVALSVHRQQG
jgi:hypothetical protein